MTYRTVPTTARVPEYAARAFHVKDNESNSIDNAFPIQKPKSLS